LIENEDLTRERQRKSFVIFPRWFLNSWCENGAFDFEAWCHPVLIDVIALCNLIYMHCFLQELSFV
jgi:hypothetical protein